MLFALKEITVMLLLLCNVVQVCDVYMDVEKEMCRGGKEDLKMLSACLESRKNLLSVGYFSAFSVCCLCFCQTEGLPCRPSIIILSSFWEACILISCNTLYNGEWLLFLADVM